ncbi:MAG TPA: hypothetical protein VGJ25_10090 [Gaiellaceae bacterium]|jgi:hypothetical protein
MARTHRLRHFSREQALEVLREAAEIVDELDPPAELREEAFRSAAAMVSKVTLTIEQPGALPDLSVRR